MGKNMYRRSYLQIPGPTNIPEPILRALSQPAINHRDQEFASLLRENEEGLKEVFKTRNDILVFPSSGTGGLEAAVVNVLSPGDRFLASNAGVFSDRFASIAKTFGADVTTLQVEWGEAPTAGQVREILAQDTDKAIRAVLVTHNETSTGVTTDVAFIRKVLDEFDHPALLMVDAVSSLCITDLPTDELRLDVVVASSQKGLMLPGGLAIISVSEKAWQAHRVAQCPRWYWDFSAVKQKAMVGQMPYTPAVSLFFGLKVALELIRQEGLEAVFARHAANALATQRGIEAAGLKLLVTDANARSNAVTAAVLPTGITYHTLASTIKKYGVVIGGGLQRLDGKIFRIGHLGMLHELEVIAILAALEMSLSKLNCPINLGVAVRAAQETYLGC